MQDSSLFDLRVSSSRLMLKHSNFVQIWFGRDHITCMLRIVV